MKETGIEWIGEIPEGWSLNRVKYIFDVSRGDVIAKTDLIDDGKYPVYSSQTENDGIFGYLNTYNYTGKALTWTTDGEKAGTVFYREGKYNCTNICGILKVKENYKKKIDLKFFYYAIKMIAEENKRKDINGYKIMSNEMALLSTTCPPLSEQKAIANFLDKKTKSIDNIKETLIKQIEILKNYKKSLIYETTTKGLNKDVKLKDSGVEWIGEIPEDWKVKRLKYMADAGATTLNISDAKKSGKYELYDVNKMVGYTDDFYIPKDYISIIKDGTVGRTRIMPAKSSITNTMNYITTKDELDLKFLFYLLNVFDFNKYTKKTTIPHIYFSSYSNEFMPLPSLSEQKAIADFLDKKTSSIDKIIESKQQQIEDIENYKKSLIYEYTTGKKRIENK